MTAEMKLLICATAVAIVLGVLAVRIYRGGATPPCG